MLADFAEIVEPNTLDHELLAQVDWARVPQHIAVIMDGNGRWATARNRPRVFGHRTGIESVRAIVDTGARLGLKALTLFAFSTENWVRPSLEVRALMRYLRHYLKIETDNLDKQNIRFRAIGRINGLPANVQKDLANATGKTERNNGMTLNIALNYGGRAEIVDACRAAAQEMLRRGENLADLSEANIAAKLYTSDLPELDLLVRTSGEMRISNFLLWQAAYSEIYVTKTLFPDFRRTQLLEAVIEFQQRERRFGNVGAKDKG